jgi:uncharacterized protein YegP (UPF0339 family)
VKFHLYRGKHGFWARLISRNGKIRWRTSETYTQRAGAMAAINALVDAGLKLSLVDHTKPGAKR